MAKLPQPTSVNAAKKRKQALRAAEMIERVQRYHRLGREKLSVQVLVEEHDLSPATAFKANQFARRYTVHELKAFLKLRREGQEPGENGQPLHWGHIQYLLLVPRDKKAIRKELQKKAAKHNWNSKELLAEIRRRIPGERGPGGRPRKNGPGSKAFIPSLTAEINDVADRVRHLVEKLRSGELRATQQHRSQLASLDRVVHELEEIIRRVRHVHQRTSR